MNAKTKQRRETLFLVIVVSVALHFTVFVIFGSWTLFKWLVQEDDPFEMVEEVPIDPVKKVFRTKAKKLQKRTSTPKPVTKINLRMPDLTVPRVEVQPQRASRGNARGRGLFPGMGIGEEKGLMADDFGLDLPAIIAERCDTSTRKARLLKSGGRPKAEKAVMAALRWLQSVQNEDGSWGTDHPVAMTGFALLSFLGHCETTESPEFKDAVRRAIKYLVKRGEEGEGGLLSSTGKLARPAGYENGIATYALAEAYTLTPDFRRKELKIAETLEASMRQLIKGQSPAGGWNYAYGPADEGDLSVSGWQIQALKAASETGLVFSGLTGAKKKAIAYLRKTRDEAGAYRYRIADEKGKTSLTGVGLLCFYVLGVEEPDLEDESIDIILKNIPPDKWDEGQPSLYAYYYHTQALFWKGKRPWKDWNKVFQDWCVDGQNRAGFWPPEGADPTKAGTATQGKKDGDIYRTCLCTLMLEVYYRYLPSINR